MADRRIKVIPRSVAVDVAHSMAALHSTEKSVLAAALTKLDEMGDRSNTFEICQDGHGIIMLISKDRLYDFQLNGEIYTGPSSITVSGDANPV